MYGGDQQVGWNGKRLLTAQALSGTGTLENKNCSYGAGLRRPKATIEHHPRENLERVSLGLTREMGIVRERYGGGGERTLFLTKRSDNPSRPVSRGINIAVKA